METSKNNGIGTQSSNFFKRLLEHRRLPAILAIGAIIVMLPALKVGLVADDLVQRAVELRPDQLPARMQDTGMPQNSGSLGTVLHDLFPGITRMAQAKDYGVLPWWAPDDLHLGLWRPLTAFTHWLDYRFFPDSPALMHAENIACFAAIVFLVTVIYRKLDVTSGGARLLTSRLAGTLAPPPSKATGPSWAAGLAALLFLLDGNTYFPVMFVANRGFMLSLLFGLLCFYEHHQWRSAKSSSALALSALFLALSLFANEGGASTFAFILAYVLVLEPGSLGRRALTVFPSVLVIILWRAVYQRFTPGVAGVGGYIDPANEPLLFAHEVVPRTLVLLGAQISGIAPEFLLAVKPSLQSAPVVLYGALFIVALTVFLPWLRRDKIAVFWLAVMVLAAIPAAMVLPLSKNLGFVAVGAYGLIASFISGLASRPRQLPEALRYKIPAWTACVLLLLAHVPGAVAGRILTVQALQDVFKALPYFANAGQSSDLENKNIVVINDPCALTLAYAPFYKAYYHRPLPRSIRTLVPGGTDFDVRRTDDKTLVIQSRSPNIFSWNDLGPVHRVYAVSACNTAIGVPQCKRCSLNGLTVEVLESDPSGLASRVSFRFDKPLESADFLWLQWDWTSDSFKPFQPPAVGQSVPLLGPSLIANTGQKKYRSK
jgi:hypothetical protein